MGDTPQLDGRACRGGAGPLGARRRVVLRGDRGGRHARSSSARTPSTEDGRVLLRVPEDSALLAAAICAPRGEPSAVLEFADVAPVPVRNRIRARLWIAGWFAPEDGELAFRPTRVVLREPSGAVVVDLDEFAAAAPDPLATAESRLLTHLADATPTRSSGSPGSSSTTACTARSASSRSPSTGTD